VQAAASQILTNSTIGGSATNMFNQISTYPFAGLSLAHSGTNGITLQTAPGGPLSVSLSAGWGTVVLTTNTLTSATVVRVPTSVEAAAVRTNVNSGLMAGLRDPSDTNQFYEIDFQVANLVGRTNAQDIPGIKQITNYNNTLNGSNITGVGNSPIWLWNPSDNSVNLKFGSTGPGGSTNTISGTPGGFAFSGTWGGVTFGSQCIFSADILLGDFSIIGTHAVMNTNGFFGTGSGITNLNGANITANTITQDQLTTNGMRILGTNTFPVGSDIAFGRYALSSLANGNNAAIVVGTNVFVEVSGPSGAFTINGIAGGRDGKEIKIYNNTGQNMTIAHESGVDPTAANRIRTMTDADRSTTGNGFVTLIYSGAASRWIEESFNP
jgi:hypothetical protein